MTRQWHKRRPELIEEIRAGLEAHYPTLHLFFDQHGRAEVRGTFPVVSDAGETLDRYQVSIKLPPGFPAVLPLVRETGGRIPWTADRHVYAEGIACVIYPDDRWRCFPPGAPFLDFLNGPLRNYFLGQAIVERGGKWPFGEWGHGNIAVYEYYFDLLGTTDPYLVRRFLNVLRQPFMKLRWRCPCGSGLRIEECCKNRIADLRAKIPSHLAADSFHRIRAQRLLIPRLPRFGGPRTLQAACGRPVGLTND